MSIRINGESYELDTPTTVEAVLRVLGQAREDIAIAVDGAVVPRSGWSDTEVPDGADIEIVTARQGG